MIVGYYRYIITQHILNNILFFSNVFIIQSNKLTVVGFEPTKLKPSRAKSSALTIEPYCFDFIYVYMNKQS